MTPTHFLTVAGPASLFIGILGILEPSFTDDFWFDTAENVVHTGFGIIAILMVAASARVQWHFVFWTSLLTLFVAVGGLIVADNPVPNFVITNLEHPIDNALHLTFVVAGFLSVLPTRLIFGSMKT